eukprot:7344659-Ditylum_brightwellii.AAC.1
MESLIGEHIITSVNQMSTTLPNICYLISPMIDATLQMQNEYGDINLAKVDTLKVGMHMTQTCLDTWTK